MENSLFNNLDIAIVGFSLGHEVSIQRFILQVVSCSQLFCRWFNCSAWASRGTVGPGSSAEKYRLWSETYSSVSASEDLTLRLAGGLPPVDIRGADLRADITRSQKKWQIFIQGHYVRAITNQALLNPNDAIEAQEHITSELPRWPYDRIHIW